MFHSGSRRTALLKWLLLATIVVSGVITVATVAANASASSSVRSEAQHSLLIAEMQSAVQVESEAAALFVADLPMGGAPPEEPGDAMDSHDGAEMASAHDMTSSATDLSDHPDVVDASRTFVEAASGLRATGSPDAILAVEDAMIAHTAFMESLYLLNAAAHGGDDAMSIYHADTLVAEAELRSAVQRLREQAALGLEDAIIRTERSQTLFSIMLPIAAMVGLTAAISLVRSRAVWRRLHFLEELVAAKDRFIGTVSHELRTPLSAIVGFTGLLASDESELGEEEKSEYLSLILSQGNEVASIVEDLLVGARAEIGELVIADTQVDLAAQLRQVLESLPMSDGLIASSGPEIHAQGDPGRVRQILRNLVTNAMRYGGERIRVELSDDEGRANVRVMDNGKPIPVEDQDRIFEPYTTLEEIRPVTGSIGLGLAVSRQLAVLMGGDLRYEYREGHSIFHLSLRAANGKAPLVTNVPALSGRDRSDL